MSSQSRSRFDGLVPALSLIDLPGAEDSRLAPGMLSRTLGSGRATAMPIQFAPEPHPTADTLDISEEQTTGPLPLNFEFEFFGIHYTWFDLSSEGFITFGTDSPPSGSDSTQDRGFIPLNEDLSNFLALGCIGVLLPERRRIAYEVRGTAPRRRLVLSFAPIPGPLEAEAGGMATQVILHERTGMIEVHATRRAAKGSGVDGAAVRLTTSPKMCQA
jgi:hypothetical protein